MEGDSLRRTGGSFENAQLRASCRAASLADSRRAITSLRLKSALSTLAVLGSEDAASPAGEYPVRAGTCRPHDRPSAQPLPETLQCRHPGRQLLVVAKIGTTVADFPPVGRVASSRFRMARSSAAVPDLTNRSGGIKVFRASPLG